MIAELLIDNKINNKSNTSEKKKSIDPFDEEFEDILTEVHIKFDTYAIITKTLTKPMFPKIGENGERKN